MFVYGTQYLRGFTPEKDQWEKDMESMKKLGFNTIRAWMVWNAIERSEGNIDHRYIEDFLNLAEKYDLQVGLLFHMHAAPAWAVQKFSKYFYMTEDNLPFEPAIRANTPSGGWPGLCYDNEEVRDMERRFITSVISESKKHKNVAFYEPMNEPHQWVDYTKSPSGIFCYCPASVKKFQNWLEKKYKDVDVLNNAWGHFYNSFDEVRPPRWTSGYSDYIDFRQFTIDNVVDEITFRSNIIRESDNKPVIAHAWGGGCVTCPQLGGMAFDDWKNAEVFDKWGYSAFPKTASDCAVLGMGCDATRSAAQGKEYWQSELTAGVTGNIFRQNGRVDDDTFDKFTLESIRHGAEGLLYWQYRKERIGSEFGGFSMTDFDGGSTPLTVRAGKLGEMLSKHGHLLKEGKMKEAEVGIVFSMRSYLADWSTSGKKSNKFAIDCLSGYYTMFWEENMTVDIIHEEFANDLSKYKLLILPTATAIAPEFAEKLKAYIAQGGTVLSEQMFGIFDPTFKLSYAVPGYGFDKIFGANEDDLLPRSSITLTGADGILKLEGNRYAETLKNVDADMLYSYEDGSPAIIQKAYGGGTVIYSGVNLGFCYSGRELIGDDFSSEDKANISTGSKKFVMNLCSKLGVKENLCSAKDVKVSLVEAENSAIIIAINSSDKKRVGNIALNKKYETVQVVYGQGEAKIQGQGLRFELEANKSAVFRLDC